MQRSKQQALMFLLGAVLIGGVLGFSADRVMSKKPQRTSARVRMYDDIGITPEQRVRMDSVLDATNCKTSDLLKPIRPAMDSIRAEGVKTLLSLMTPEQRLAYDAREKRVRAIFDSVEKARAARGESRLEHARRCAGSRPAPGAGAGPESRGAGGPSFR
jgi:hypothetical protein